MATLSVWTPLSLPPPLNKKTQNRLPASNVFGSSTDNTEAAGCGFCVCLGRRCQWRHSAAVTAAGKLVISNLVYLSPLQ